MKKRIIAVILVVMMLAVGIGTAAAENEMHLQSVIFQEDGTLDLVVAVPSTENLQPADFKVVANKEVVAASSVYSIGRSDVVTSWVFVLDISMNQRFEESKNTISELISLLPEKDQFALMTAGMSAGELRWSSNKTEVKNQVKALERNGKATALNAAVAEVVAMLENQSPAPDRACVVVISNGENNDVTGMTQNELVENISNSHVAVYTLALQKSEPNSTKVSNYGAYARAGEGGAEIILKNSDKDAASHANQVMQNELNYRVIKVANENLPEEISSFAVSFQEGAVALSDEYQLSTVRQLAYEAWMNVHRSQQPVVTPDPTGAVTPTPKPTPTPTPTPTPVPRFDLDELIKWLESNMVYILAGLLVVLLILLVTLKRGKKVTVIDDTPDVKPDVKPDKPEEDDDSGVTVVDTNSIKLLIKLTRTNDGSVHAVTMNDSITVGREGGKANLVITGDDKMSRVHAKISMIRGAIVLENLSETNGTYVNGKKIDRPVQLHQQDVLKMGENYYQISWSMQ